MAYKNDKPSTPEGGTGTQSGVNPELSSSFATVGDLFSVAAKPGLGDRVGASLPTPVWDTTSTTDSDLTYLLDHWYYGIPQFARVGWTPVYGISNDINSYLNKASMRVYRQIQDTLRQRTLPYQHTDVSIVLLAHDSLILGYLHALRIYTALDFANKYSRYFPKTFVRTLGADFNDWSQHRPEIVETLKTWRRDLNDYPLPKVFKAIDCHYEMMQRVYADASSTKAQLYVCAPTTLWSYEGVDKVKGLKAIHPDLTWNGFKRQYNAMLTAIKDSSDFDTITSAIRSTYGDVEGYEIPEVGNFRIDIVKDGYFLSTLTNAIVMNQELDIRITDSGMNYLTCTVETHDQETSALAPDVFNTLTDNPTSEEMVNYSRWHPQLKIKNQRIVVESCGTEIITDFRVFFDQEAKAGLMYVTHSVKPGTGGETPEVAAPESVSLPHLTDAGDNRDMFLALSALEAFKWHPTVWITVSSGYISGMFPFTQWNFEFSYSQDDLVSAHNAWMDAAFSGSPTTSA